MQKLFMNRRLIYFVPGFSLDQMGDPYATHSTNPKTPVLTPEQSKKLYEEAILELRGEKPKSKIADTPKPEPLPPPEPPKNDFWGGAMGVAGSVLTGTAPKMQDVQKASAPLVEGAKAGAAAVGEFSRPGTINNALRTVTGQADPMYNKPFNAAADLIEKNTQGASGDAARAGVQDIESGANEVGQALDPRTNMSASDRGWKGLEGVTDIAAGGMGAYYAPVSSAIEQVGGVRDVVHAGMGLLTEGTQAVGHQVTNTMGIDPNSEHGQTVLKAVDTLGQLGMLKVAHETTKALGRESAITKANKALDFAKKSGDVGAINNAMGALEKATSAPAPSAVGNFAEGVVSGTKLIGGKGLELVKNVSGKAGKLGGDIGRSALSMTSGLGRDTIKTALENPDLLSEAQKAGLDASRSKVLESIKNPLDAKAAELSQKIDEGKNSIFETTKGAIDQRLKDISETGSGYDAIRKSTEPVNLADANGNSWFENFVQSKGLDFENGKIVANKTSAIRSPGELARLNGLYDLYGKYTDFTPQEFLNFRRDVGGLAKFGEGITTDMSSFAKDFYSKLNEKGRPQIQNLEGIDKQFGPLKQSIKDAKKIIYDKAGDVRPDAFERVNAQLQKGKPEIIAALKQVIPDIEGFMEKVKTHGQAIQDLKTISNTLYDASGNLKDNAVSLANNLINKGKEGRLNMLKEALPDFNVDHFTKQIKVVKALEDIEISKGVKIGTYGHNILGIASITTGNIPGIIAAISTHPTIVIPVLKAFGRTIGKTAEFSERVGAKVLEGIKPVGIEAQFVQDAFKKTTPTRLKYFITNEEKKKIQP